MTKDEAIKHLKDFVYKIDTQDNRATANPYFYVIQTERWRVAHDEYHSGATKIVWVDTGGSDDYTEYESKEAAVKGLVDSDYMGQAEAETYVEENFREFTMEKYIDESNVFFTEDGYKDHVRLNGHNLGKRGKDYYSYIKHAFRNPEIEELFSAIRALASDGTEGGANV